MITIIDRKRLSEIVALYEKSGTVVNFILLGQGTAPDNVRSILGMDRSEKAICFSVVTDETFIKIKKGLEQEIRIDIPGTGIVFVVPMSSVGGKRELQFLTAGQHFEKGEESVMKDTSHELIVVISAQGYNDDVMKAARKAGAQGGTIVHAQGTGMNQAEKFLGITLASEKDILFIVSKTENKNAIMKSIMEECGVNTKAKAIAFSLPVTDTAGLRLIENAD